MATYSKILFFDFYRDGHYVLLEIWRKGASQQEAYRIANLQGLCINLQGGAETVESPILKTTCEVSIVDYQNQEISFGTDAKGNPCKQQWGEWEDTFYTMDSTQFLAKVYQDDVLRWSGYLTPDTWDEDLVYAGSVTLTFRDNLGHLADLPFDAAGNEDGLISAREIVETALARIDCPMSLGSLECELMATDGDNHINAVDACFSVLAFAEKSWLEAVESVLESLGLVLRYNDNNTLLLMAIRQMPQTHKTDKAPRAVKDVMFLNRSGHRSKEPVFRSVEESVTFEVSRDASFGVPKADDFGPDDLQYGDTSMDVEFYVAPNDESPAGFGGWGPVHMLVGEHWKTDSLIHSLAFNPYVYPIDPYFQNESLSQILDNNVYIAANVKEQGIILQRCVCYEQRLERQRGRFVLTFGHPISKYNWAIQGAGQPDGYECIGYPYHELNLKSITYAVKYVTDAGSELFMTARGSWQVGRQLITKEYEGNSYTETLEVAFDATEFSTGIVRLCIYDIQYKGQPGVAGSYNARSVYARVADFRFESIDSDLLPESDKTTTIYNEDANVKYTRNPEFGTADVPGLGSTRMMPNLIFSPYRNTGHLPLTQWYWKDAEETQKLSVISAKQILCYHCRAMSYLTGSIADATEKDPRFDDLYRWNNQKLMLISGSLNLLNGFMDSVALREYELYYNLWDEEDTRAFFVLGDSKLGSNDKLE